MLKAVWFFHSNDGAQSDDEDKLQSQQSDTDGGRLKQKT